MDKSYDLNDDHYNRYFGPRKNPAKLLRAIARWMESEGDIQISSIANNHWYSDEEEAIVYDATVLYTRGF